MKLVDPYLQDVFQWDAYNWSRALSFWQANSNLDMKNSTAVELGARNGGLSLWLAEHFKNVLCTDLTNPRAEAKILHDKYKRTGIEYAALDVTTLQAQEQYDMVVSKSLLFCFDKVQKEKAIQNIYNSLKWGGEYWFVENLRSTPMHAFLRRNFAPWGKRSNYLDINDLPAALHNFYEVKYFTLGFVGLLGRNEMQRNLLGVIDKYFFEKITTQEMRYVIVGVAKKNFGVD